MLTVATIPNTLSSILSPSLRKYIFLFSLQSFHFPVCPKLIVKMFILLATPTAFTSFPFFFRVIYSGEEVEFSFLSNISRHPSGGVSVAFSSAVHLIVYFLLHAGQASNKPYGLQLLCCALVLCPVTLPGSNVLGAAISPQSVLLADSFPLV